MLVGRLWEFRRAIKEFRTAVETNHQTTDPEPLIQPRSPTATGPAAATASLPSEGEPQFAEPVTEATATQTTVTEAAEITEPYCGQRGSRLFHRRECSWVSRIPEVERVYLKRVADARDQGLLECPVCEPWEPA